MYNIEAKENREKEEKLNKLKNYYYSETKNEKPSMKEKERHFRCFSFSLIHSNNVRQHPL